MPAPARRRRPDCRRCLFRSDAAHQEPAHPGSRAGAAPDRLPRPGLGTVRDPAGRPGANLPDPPGPERGPTLNLPPSLAGEGRGGGRIVLVSHSREVGGAELHVERLARYLVGKLEPACRLEIICRPDPVLDAWAARMAAAGVVVHRLGLAGPGDLWRMVRILGGARLVHIHLAHPVGKYQWVAALAARITGQRIIATHHLAPDIRGLALGERSRELWF